MRDLSLRLEMLVSELEAEIRETGKIGRNSSELVHDLRAKFEKLFGRDNS